MRLRSLEIGGYKSFANRTELRFDSGMTAVVGPNGSGKSNIMDALRWVIGEGANRALRVRRLDDVIFSGSSQRPPAGLADVRLRLDNNGGWLGLDAAEVEVQRRIHRDGESEFRLNGRPVRLRDIQDLFHNSGLGSGGYALMGQGLVDEVLRLRPLERRRLIEEAADVRRHHRKMHESRRQRERAEEHLSRARLLRGELEPRLRTLERQAGRARRRAELEAELEAALRTWYGAASHALSAEAQQRRAASEAAEAQQQRAVAELSGAGAAVDAAAQASVEARALAERAAADQRTAAARLAELQHEHELGESRRRWMTAEAERLSSERDSAGGLDAAAMDIAGAEAALRGVERKLRETRARRDERSRRLAVAEALRSRQQRERNELRAEAQALGVAWPACLGAVRKLAEAQSAAAQRSRESDEAQASAREVEAESAAQLERARAAQREHGVQRSKLMREIDELSARVAALDELSGQSSANSSEGAAPRLGSLLTVRPGYEAAIEAALGAAAEAELLPSAAAALSRAAAALQRADDGEVWIGAAADLVGRGGAQGTTAPLPPPLANGAAAAPSAAVARLIAADVVEAPTELLPLVRALLGEVWIVEQSSEARTLLARAAPPAAVVTLDGLLLRRDGVVAVGGDQGASRARQQRRSKWLERRAALEADLARLPRGVEERLAAAEEQRAAAGAAAARAEEHRRAAAAALTESERALRTAESERGALQNGARRLQSRLQRLRAEAAAVDPPSAEPQDEGDLSALEERRDRAAARLAQVRASAEQRRRSEQAAARLSEIRAELADIDEAAAARTSSLAEARAAAADRGAVEAARARLGRAEREQREARRRLDAAQSARVQAERAVVEAQAALRETEAARGRLTDAAADDGIDLDTLDTLPPPAALLPDVDALRAAAAQLRQRLQRIGSVQPEAAEEYEMVRERSRSLEEQITDLERTEARLREAERELETLIETSFRDAFDKVDAAFRRYFSLMFSGGRARLALVQDAPSAAADAEVESGEDASSVDAPHSGVEISAQPPGKRVAHLSQLSGGERALTAVALLFALLEIRPVPFCVLDEVDAALDEANVERFVQALKARAADVQFVVITHNRRTIEQADAIYGVTMGGDGLSKVLSVRLNDLPAN